MIPSLTSPQVLRGAVSVMLLVGVAAGCRCNDGTNRRFPDIDVRDRQIDFGGCQVDVEHTRELVIYNGGADTLIVSELRTEAPFGTRDELPLTVGVGREVTLTVTFLPTEVDKRVSGELVIVSDDPEEPEITVALVGSGIQASAVATPSPIDFGDVYVGESKTVQVTIRNAGTNQLNVLGATFLPDTPPSVTGNLAPIAEDIPSSGTTTTSITFSPTQMSENIPGGIRLELDEKQGGELIIPFSGRGVRAIPRLCFRFEGVPMEQCTSPDASSMGGSSLPVVFPPMCDNLLYPSDGGAPSSVCGGAPYSMKGQVYVRNEGNIPVSYSMKYIADVEQDDCGGTEEPVIDFAFSNAPSESTVIWDEPTTELGPMSESAPIDITYTPTTRCKDEAADQAQIWWTRQGDLRQPGFLTAFITGQSRLPEALPHPVSLPSGKAPSPLVIHGADNRGNAEFQILSVRYEEFAAPPPGPGKCHPLDAGVVTVPCDFDNNDNPVSDCYAFSWAPGEDPNQTAPHTIPFAADGGIGSVQIGTLMFGKDGADINRTYCLKQIVETTDPFNPIVVSPVMAVCVGPCVP